MTFCKACGTLAPMGACPKGHDATLTDKIKSVIHSEDGTRVLVSNNNVSLGKEFWSYRCEHRTVIYVLKAQREKPASFLRIPLGANPCPKKSRLHEAETYNLRDILIPKAPYEKSEVERSLEQARMNLYNWPDGTNKR
jgi:hypothetical protein